MEPIGKRSKTAFFLIVILMGLASCNMGGSNTAILWTDRPEFAFYAEHFNASQDRYKVEVRFFESPAQRLGEEGETPDMVVASWLKSSASRALFRPLDNLFRNNGIPRSSFYPRLLSLANLDGRQYLLPLSFNIPAMVFAMDFSQSHSNPFIIEMEEIKERSQAHNLEAGGAFTRMGFSLSSNEEFLFIVSTLFGAGFREASPITWDSQALEQSIAWLQQWINEANISVEMEEDFVFTHLFDPPDRLINSGRIFYTYMNSARFFTLTEERRMNLDFRWIAAGETIPVDESSVYFGIHRRARARPAAEAFARWFFNTETQRLLLEAAKGMRLLETSFGIAGGFSAMKTVTEQVFPLFYPDLLGHIPPEDFLSPANVLPRNWMEIKERVILPYLRERIRYSLRDEVRPLDRRVSDWHRLNRE